jgi:hypothetical protein
MANATFNHSGAAITAGTSQTVLYGPVTSGTTVIVFAGTFANTDTTNQVNHWVTLVKDNGSGVQTPLLTQVPIPFGGTSMCPKVVLLAGELLYFQADTASVVSGSVEIVSLS